MHDLQPRAIGLTAKYRAALRVGERAALVHDVVAAVAHAEIDHPVGAEREPVEIVTMEGDADAIARVEHVADIGHAVAVGVAHPPEVRDAGVKDVAAAGEHPRAVPLDEPVEPGGEDGGSVGPAVAIRIDQFAEAVGLDHPLPGLLSQKPQMVGQPVVDRLGREVGLEPGRALLAGVVAHALVRAKSLADEHAAPLVDREGDGIGEIGLGGEEFDREARRQAEPGRGLGRLVGRGRDRRLTRRWRRIDRIGGSEGRARGNGETADDEEQSRLHARPPDRWRSPPFTRP